jgi:hypothetical protein
LTDGTVRIDGQQPSIRSRDPIIRIRVGPIIHIPRRTQMQIRAVTLQLRQQHLRTVQVIPKSRRIHRRYRREPRRLIQALLTLRGLDFRRWKVARLIDCRSDRVPPATLFS